MSLDACVFAPPRASRSPHPAGAEAVANTHTDADTHAVADSVEARSLDTASPGEDFAWGLLDARAAPAAAARSGVGLASLVAALGDARPDSLTLVLPGEDVLATQVSIPARSRRQFEAALPYVVEEFLAEDVDGLHISAGSRDRDGRVAVRVLAPDVLRAAIDALAAHGLAADSARVDHDALPVDAPGHCELWLDEVRALVRTADSGLAVDRDDLLAVLPMVLRQGGATGAGTLQVRATAASAGSLDLAELEPLLAQQSAVEAAGSADTAAAFRIEHRALEGSLVEALTVALVAARGTGAAGSGPELLTGPFRVRSATGETRFGRWRLVAGLAIAWLLAELLLDSARVNWLEARAETLRGESVALFRELYPERTRIPDPRRELEAMLGPGATTGSESLMVLLGVLSAAAAELDERVQLRSINYNADRGDLAVDLSASGIATVDRLKEALERVGYPISIDSAVQEANGVRARMRMRGQGDSA